MKMITTRLNTTDSSKKLNEEKIQSANTHLLDATKSGDLVAIIAALKQGADIECSDSQQYKPIHLAAIYSNQAIIDYLLEHGANIHCKKGKGSPIHYAAIHGNLEAIKALATRNPSIINEQAQYGYTPLHYAVSYNHFEAVKLLLNLGANFEIRTIMRENTDGITPLELAFTIHHRDTKTDGYYFYPISNLDRSLIMRSLVEHEMIVKNRTTADIVDEYVRKYTESRYCIGRILYECKVQLFSDLPSDTLLKDILFNEDCAKILMIELNKVDLYSKIIHYLSPDNDIQLKSKETILNQTIQFYKESDSALLSAAIKGDVKQFMNALYDGANVNHWDDWGQALHHISDKRKNYENPRDAIQLLHQLLKSGSKLEKNKGTLKDRNDTWGDNIIPIQWILNNSQFDLAVLLCASGFNIVEIKEYFYNGLWWSSVNYWPAIIQRYLAKDINDDKGILNKKDLRIAYAYYQSIEAGAYADAKEVNQDCLLWLCAILGDIKPLKTLDLFHADVNKYIPICRFTPLMMASHCGNKEMVTFLLQHGAKIDAQFVTIDPYPGLPKVQAWYNASLKERTEGLKEIPDSLFLAKNSRCESIINILADKGKQLPHNQIIITDESLPKLSKLNKNQLINSISEENQMKGRQQETIDTLQIQIMKHEQQLKELEDKLHTKDKQIEALQLQIQELNKKANPKYIFSNILLEAAVKGSMEKINAALVFDADIRSKNENGQTALHLSVQNNHLGMSDFLIEKDQSLFMIPDKDDLTPMQHQAQIGQLNMLDWLYDKGKNISDFSGNQEAFNRVYEVASTEAKLFLANKRLLESAKTGKAVGILDALQKGANINVKANDGETALYKAVYSKDFNIASLLIEHGADPTIRTNKLFEEISKQHDTTLHYAKTLNDQTFISLLATPYLIFAALHSKEQDILYALELGAHLNGRDVHGQTALHKAVLTGDITILKLLLKKHAELQPDIDMADANGKTPYDLAVQSGIKIKNNEKDIKLEVFLIQKFSAYKKEIKLYRKSIMSNSSFNFIASIGREEMNQAENKTDSNVESLHNSLFSPVKK